MLCKNRTPRRLQPGNGLSSHLGPLKKHAERETAFYSGRSARPQPVSLMARQSQRRHNQEGAGNSHRGVQGRVRAYPFVYGCGLFSSNPERYTEIKRSTTFHHLPRHRVSATQTDVELAGVGKMSQQSWR